MAVGASFDGQRMQKKTAHVLLGSAYDCHQTDEWKDPQEGKQDCLMDRVHLCGNKGDNVNWD